MLIGAAAVVAVWLAWLFAARVAVMEVSDDARLEVGAAAHPVQAEVGGRVVSTTLVLGRDVKEGDVLLDLDARAERLQLEEARLRRTTLQNQVEPLRNELVARERVRLEARLAAEAQLSEARARQHEAALRARIASEEASRIATLRDGGHVGELEALKALGEAETRGVNVEALGHDLARLERDARVRESENSAALERLRRDVASMDGEIGSLGATIDRLEFEIARRTVRAPIGGRLGDVVLLQEGAFVQPGTRVCTVVPRGDLRVVAEFRAATAVGRVQSGQRAKVRLTGFPWTEYGSLDAVVDSVGTEPINGLVRAELLLDASARTRIPMQHGLPGTVYVEVERVSPATLVLRAAGKTVMPEPAGAPSAAQSAAPRAQIP
jgi:membrane fusion protein (multidrug efflux system)